MKKKLAIEVLLEGKCVKIGSRIFKLKINTIALWKKENNCYWDVNICINTFLTTNFEIVPDPQQEYYRKEINKILNNGKFVNVKFEGGGQLQGSQETYTTLSNETIMEKIKKSKPIVSYTEVKEEPDYKKGDAVILNNPDGKLQIITFMNDTNEYVYTKDGGFKASYIKRKATLKDLQAEIKRMFEKYDEYKSGNGIYHLSDDGFLMYKDLIEKFQVPLLYDVLLNFIINAKPITDEQPEKYENLVKSNVSSLFLTGIVSSIV